MTKVNRVAGSSPVGTLWRHKDMFESEKEYRAAVKAEREAAGVDLDVDDELEGDEPPELGDPTPRPSKQTAKKASTKIETPAEWEEID